MPTQAELDAEQVRKDESEKRRLEKILAALFLALFDKINNENTKNIIETGIPISGDERIEEIERLLEKHYRTVQNSFYGTVSDRLPEDEQALSASETAILLAVLKEWSENRKKRVASQISETNRRQIREAFTQSRQLLEEQGQPVDNRNVAATSKKLFKRKYQPRSNLIGLTETQAAAESSKMAEASVLSGVPQDQVLRPVTNPLIESEKIWRTVGDEFVRQLHVDVNGTRKPLNEPFVSGGERLMHPGDTSLGATLKNTANCRCSLTFRIKRVER